MLSRNNFTERSKKIGSQNKQENFSIRKLTVGAASVLIGLGFVNANNQVVKADAQKPQGETNVQTNNQGQTASSSADQQQADTATTAGTNASINDNTQTGKHNQAEASDQPKVKLTTFAGLTSFLRDATVPETPKTSEEVPASAPSSSAEQQPEDTADQNKKVEAEQKLNAAATSLNTALDQAKTISNSDKYKQETLEKQEALQTTIAQAQTVANKYHDLGSSPLSEDDQTKLLADITAASDKLTTLLAEYTTKKEQVGPQDGISLRSNSGTDGSDSWEFNSSTGTLTYRAVGDGKLSGYNYNYYDDGSISNIMSRAGISAYSVKKIVFGNDIKLAANSSRKFADLPNLTAIEGLNNLDTSAVTDMSYMFCNDSSLTSLDLPNWNTGNVTNMSYMFCSVRNLTSLNLSSWNTGSVYNMSHMFDGNGNSHLATITLGNGWHTAVTVDAGGNPIGTDMSYMFANLYGQSGQYTGLQTLNLTGLDTSNAGNMADMFYNDRELTSITFGSWNTSKVTNMSQMFYNDQKLKTADLNIAASGNYWNTGSVTNMSQMFSYTGLTDTLDLSNWNVGNVEDMSQMFSYSSNLRGITFTNWNTGKVKNMSNMFQTTRLTSLNVSNFDTHSVTDMSYMFNNIGSSITTLTLAKSVNSWDTSKVVNMNNMFSSTYFSVIGSGGLNLDSWDTSSVTDMSGMFQSMYNLTSVDLDKWNISKVTTMNSMFKSDGSLKSIDLHHNGNNWAIGSDSSVTSIDMGQMFRDCSSLKTDSSTKALNLDGWDTSKVTNMSRMFQNCSRLTSSDDIMNISNWDTSNVVNMRKMFRDCTNLKTLSINNWNTSNVQNMAEMFYNDTQLGNDGTNTLNIDKWNTSSVRGANTYDLDDPWDDYDYNNGMQYMFYKCTSLKKLDLHAYTDSAGSHWDVSGTIGGNNAMDYMFAGCSNLEDLDIHSWDTTNVVRMSYMFSGCTKLNSTTIHDGSAPGSPTKFTLDASGSYWHTGNVTTMRGMFVNCSALNNFTFKNWNTESVRDMSIMFENCTSLTGDSVAKSGIATFNTSAVTTMASMFQNCTSLVSLDLHAYSDGSGKHWDVSGTIGGSNTMGWMFAGCTNLEDLDIHSWDTMNVKDMSYMFYNCTKLNSTTIHNGAPNGLPPTWPTTTPTAFTLNSSGSYWNTGKVTTMQGMFLNCTDLNDIDFKGGWINSNLDDMSYMFNKCTSLTGKSVDANGIADFKTSKVSTMAHMFDGDSSIKDLVLKYDTGNLLYMSYMFANMYDSTTPEKGLKYIDITKMNTSTVTDMSYLFHNDELLNNLNVDTFNTDFAENMSYMFNNCRSLTQAGSDDVLDDIDPDTHSEYRPSYYPKHEFNVSNWITRFVSNMDHMFAGDKSLDILNLKRQPNYKNQEAWNTSNVANMTSMFDGDIVLTSIGDVSGWDTTSVQYMTSMFNNDKKLVGEGNKLDLSGWDTRSALDMNNMFNSNEALTTLKLGPHWDTDNVGSTSTSYGMKSMFNDNKNLTTIDNNGAPWGTANITDMSNMFNGDAKVTNLDFVDSFDTSNVTNMTNMFNGNSSLTGLDLHTWNTGNVTSMQSMFNGDEALTTLTLGSAWDTRKVTDMRNMFNNTKKIKELDLSSFYTERLYTYYGMANAFNNMGADSSVKTFILHLGKFRIPNDAWGNFKWKNMQAMGDSHDYNEPAGHVYKLDKFKDAYNQAYLEYAPAKETYVLRLHGDDNLRYKVKPTRNSGVEADGNIFIIKAHTGQTQAVTAQYPAADILSFSDSDDSDAEKSYDDLLNHTADDIIPTNKVIQSANWMLSSDKNWSVDSEGNVLSKGGVLDNDGKLIDGATNTPQGNQGNAVIHIKYGDNTETYVPVKVQLPKFVAGDMQEVTSVRTLPVEAQARAAVKTSISNSGLSTWGKSHLTYSWVKSKDDLRPLQESDVNVIGDLNVAVKITYTTNGSPDGSEVIPVILLVRQYSDEFPISITRDGTVPASITTHAIGSTLKVPTPKAFSKDNMSDMTNLITVNDAASGNTNITSPEGVNVDRIIDHLDWASGGAPTFIDNGAPLANTCQIVAHYTDHSYGVGTGVKVHVFGGILQSGYSASGITLIAGGSLPPAASTTDPASALTATSVTAINNQFGNNVTYSWSTSPDGVVAPTSDTTGKGGIKSIYVIIDYGDGTTQAVPVTLNVKDMSTEYPDVGYIGGTKSIHAVDDSTDAPTLNFAAMIGDLRYNSTTSPTAFPAGKIAALEWASATNSVPGYTTNKIGPQTGQVQIRYSDGSISKPLDIHFNVEGATVTNHTKTYPCGEVPSAADFLDGTNGTQAPSSYGASYKWVDAINHQELAVNDAKGTVAAAIEVTYHDGVKTTHQYLPVTLVLQTVADQHAGEFTSNSLTTHVGVDPNNFNVHSYVTNHGSLAEGQGANDYQIVWQTQPDTSATGLKDDGTKDVHAAARITFNKDGSQLTVSVPVTINGAVIKNSDTAKTLYLNDAALSAGQQTDIANYYVNSSKLGSYAPTYTVKLNNNKAAITVHYNDGIAQTLPDVPFKVVRPVTFTRPAETYQGNSITAQQVLANYSELASIPGMTITNELSGINFNQTGTQTGYVNLNYTADDSAFSDFNGSFAVPVTVKVNVRPVDNSMAANFHPNAGGVQVPQYTDLPSHNNYADQAVTNANEMPAGTNYTWGTTSTADTSTKDKTDKTFVTVNYPDGSVGSIPVKVNVGDPQESDIVLKHNAYLYDKQGKRVNGQTLQSGSTVKTYGTALINNRMYYIIEADKYYIKAGNVVGKKRKLDSTAHVYDKYGQQTNDQVIYAGTGVTTYGTPVMIKGQKYYLIDNNKYVPADNFPPASDTWIDPTVHGNSDTSGGVKKETMHAAYFYNKNGKRKSKAILKAGSSVVTYGKTTIKHKQYYVLDNDEFLLASNIDAVKRHIKHQANVIDRYGKATGKKLHKGSKVSVYGKAVKINGVSCYVIGDNQYVKASKLK
ncbi:BspA family leucine-rich repeat surface protein [Lactobacillus sp. ESL0791]|uniref:BspA family leucine-rich repeat surface protein n=1 Tax=Lactobacillus sp. ESL0791 TaxID=2983234 RepID=UPI0023F75026|nr:BspA family leucine-rich repeat surface protein [Lactobacillus sp. ESL0791]MDF7639454.1 BspA family leucine-rich repeat surface protein [Lactobacillus sp. ESL0791]